MNQQITSIRKEDLEKLKAQLFDKIFRDLSNKYRRLLYEKDLDIKTFDKQLKKEIEKTFDYSNPNYPKAFQTIEKIFLKEISKHEDKKRGQLLSEEKVADALNLCESKRKEHQDEWTLISKYNYLTYLEEEKMRKEEDKLNKWKFKEELIKQIQLKEKIKREEKEKENKMNELEITYNMKSAPVKRIPDACSMTLVEENQKLAELKRRIKSEEEHQEKIKAESLKEKIKEELKEEELHSQIAQRKKEELREFLRKQMDEKEKPKEPTKSEKEMLEEKVSIIMQAKEKEKLKKISIQKYKDELDKQVKHKEKSHCGMTEIEKRMNKDLIERSERYLSRSHIK